MPLSYRHGVDYNELLGTIPTQLGELTELKHLLLKYNQLTGTIPSELKNLNQLDILLLEQNNLEGTAEAICMSPQYSIQHFVSDCKTGIQCTCCHECCSGPDDRTCNAGDWDGSIDPIWEYGFRRVRYSYNMGSHVMVVP